MTSLALSIELLIAVHLLLRQTFCNPHSSNAAATHSLARDLLRRSRNLLFPPPNGSETKVQVLFGLGLPMEGDVSMTLGYVLKCNYNLPPYNASDYKRDYVRHQQQQHDEIHSQEMSKGAQDKAAHGHDGAAAASRWELYRILEKTLGKACLLRTICEATKFQLMGAGDEGLLGEFLHLLLTPSATNDEYQLYSDREYRAAEAIGRANPAPTQRTCESLYSECEGNPLDYFTRELRNMVN